MTSYLTLRSYRDVSIRSIQIAPLPKGVYPNFLKHNLAEYVKAIVFYGGRRKKLNIYRSLPGNKCAYTIRGFSTKYLRLKSKDIWARDDGTLYLKMVKWKRYPMSLDEVNLFLSALSFRDRVTVEEGDRYYRLILPFRYSKLVTPNGFNEELIRAFVEMWVALYEGPLEFFY